MAFREPFDVDVPPPVRMSDEEARRCLDSTDTRGVCNRTFPHPAPIKILCQIEGSCDDGRTSVNLVSRAVYIGSELSAAGGQEFSLPFAACLPLIALTRGKHILITIDVL